MKKLDNLYYKVLYNLYFLFFTSPILSPYIGGVTFYLYWIIPLFDFKYLNYLKKIKLKRKQWNILIIMFILILVYQNFILLFRYIIIIYNISYILYLYKIKKLKYLYRYISFNIIIAILQWLFYFKNPNFAYMIGPTNIATLIWGKYAGPTFTNFYPIFYLPRASGLSREVGFFSSLLILSYLLAKKVQVSKKTKVLILIGMILSMSKMLIMFILVIFVSKLKNLLKYINLYIGLIILICVMCFISVYLDNINFFTAAHETWNHRLGGYRVISRLNFKLLWSKYKEIKNLIEIIPDIRFLTYIKELKIFTGIPNAIIHEGIYVFVVFIFVLKRFKIKFYDFLILFLLTFSVGFSTVTSFVILTYCYIFINRDERERDDRCINYISQL